MIAFDEATATEGRRNFSKGTALNAEALAKALRAGAVFVVMKAWTRNQQL